MKQTVILTILDGWGLGALNESNPIYMANPEAVNYIQSHFPSAALQASGIAVGLPWEEEGNSEVGHLTIGAGKILFEHYPKISLSIEDGSFFKNPILLKAFDHAKTNNSAVHLIGLLTGGSVHASFKHLVALVEMAKREEVSKLFLQLFADGKDSAPRSTVDLLKKTEDELKKRGVGIIASLIGRYFAMDRDNKWDRTEKAYSALIGNAERKGPIIETVLEDYKKNLNDELIPPILSPNGQPIESGDALIFFNFREDSMRQITEAFLNPAFNKFPTKKLLNLYIATFTQYDEKIKTNVAFLNETVEKPLGLVLAEAGKRQLRIAETEKYAHVTYFFNGLKERPFPGEFRILIPSQSVLHHDERPEMMASQITDRALAALSEASFDFILINYANPDIIAHTGNYDATIKAIKAVNEEIGRLTKAVIESGHILIVTGDHGNAEVVLNLQTGETETKHNSNPVPIYLISKKFERQKPKNALSRLPTIGLLSDVAPTILELMKIPKPKEMTGTSLLDQLLLL